jgi:P4 family phage/plasmid primase-like protien
MNASKMIKKPVIKPKTTTSTSAHSPLQDFLFKHRIKKEDKTEATHTRIGDEATGIYGGKFYISDEDLPTFMKLYFNEVIHKGSPEYLTEQQLYTTKNGPIAVDLDLHFSLDLDERVYTREHIEDLVFGYLEEFKEIFQFDGDTRFPVFVFEKTRLNRVQEKNITKDGIHLIFGIQMDHAAQLILREKMLPRLEEMWGDFPIVNKWSDVLDECISKGKTNWQLYGSAKPGHEAYRLTTVYDITYDPDDGEWITNTEPIENYLTAENFHKLSVRYTGNPQFFYTNEFLAKLMNREKATPSPAHGLRASMSSNSMSGGGIDGDGFFGSQNQYPSLKDVLAIKNAHDLEDCLQRFLDSISMAEYRLREIYEYAMVLPESYYGPQSYAKWIRVGWALHNTSDRLLVVWIAFSAKSSEWSWNQVSDRCNEWIGFSRKASGGINFASIIYWAKQDNRDGFESIKQNTVSYYLDQTINSISADSLKSGKNAKGCSDHDIAIVLYQLCKYDYVYCDGFWYRFANHRWETTAKPEDSGADLRLTISTKLRAMYYKRAEEMSIYKSTLDPEEDKDKITAIEKKVEIIIKIYTRLGQTSDKRNIIQEAKDLFKDSGFISKLDSNPYLLCFKNGVIDFSEKNRALMFRDGRPEDYLTKCTGIDYTPLDSSKHDGVREELEDFMAKLFPDSNIREYMWDHLSSVLIGKASVNQTFNNYIGGGQNGKSVLTDLMSQTIGNYKQSAPISLITQGRGKIGGLSPEIVSLKGARYVVMQEPTKGDVINEGPMKELVSGVEPITCRGLFQSAITFIPQFKMVVCCNELLVVKAQDHGTWRRIRVVPFESLFTENPVTGDPNKPHQFKLDRNLMDKFPVWRETFAAMLVDRAYNSHGVVTDCDRVLAASNDYRKRQDYLAEFVLDKIVRCSGATVRKSQLSEEFKVWYSINFGTRTPSPKDLHELMDREFGKQKGGVWTGVRLKMRDEEDSDIDTNAVDSDLEGMDGDIDLNEI